MITYNTDGVKLHQETRKHGLGESRGCELR